VSLHLCLVPGVPQIFGIKGGDEVENSIYINWLSMAHSAITGLEMFSPTTMQWKQAHMNARYFFVLFNYYAETGKVIKKHAKHR
jgi:hypothetical protein